MNKLPAITHLVSTVDENRRNLSFDDHGDLLIVKTILIALKGAMPEIRSLLLVNSPAQQSGFVDMGEAPQETLVAGSGILRHALHDARKSITKGTRNRKATP